MPPTLAAYSGLLVSEGTCQGLGFREGVCLGVFRVQDVERLPWGFRVWGCPAE